MAGSGTCGQCGGAASLRCGGCSAVHYCSKEHQKQHWPVHKTRCWPFIQTSDADTGRYLVASRELVEGQLVAREAPLTLGPVAESFPVCLGCHAPIQEEDFPRCPGCAWPLCSPGCATSPRHTPECAVLATDTRRIAPPTTYMKTPRYDVILVLRCLLLRSADPAGWEKLQALESHADRRKEEEESHTEASVTYFTKVLDVGCDADTVRHVHGAIITNAINTYGARGEPLRGIYPTLYLMNHSCRPNATLRSEADGTLYVRAAVPIKKGEPIVFSYVPVSDPLWRRYADLSTIYYFKCTCDRCTDHTEMGTYFSSPRCSKCSEGFLEPYEGPGSPWSCPECGESRPQEDIARETEEYAQRIHEQCTSSSEALKLLETIANTFHVNHFLWMTTAQAALKHLRDPTLQTISIRRDLWRRLLGLYHRLEPGATRRKGVTLFHAAMVEKEAAAVQLMVAGGKGRSEVVEEGMNRAVTMFDSAIKILELEPPGSTELRWLEAARKEKQEVFDLIARESEKPKM